MSDRSNRDVGRKRAFKKEHGKFGCDCWLCQDGKTKKRTMLLRQDKKESQKTKKEEV